VKKLLYLYGLNKVVKYIANFSSEDENVFHRQNILLIYTCLAVICLNPLLSFLDFWISYKVYGIASLLALLVLVVNRAGWFELSKWLFIIAINIVVLYAVVLHSSRTTVSFFFIAGIMAAFAMLDKRDLVSMAVGFSIPLGLFLIINLSGARYGSVDSTGAFRNTSFFVNIFCSVLAVIVAVYYLITIYERTVNRLKKLIVELQAKEQEIVLQNEELLKVNTILQKSQAELTKNQVFLNSIIDHLPLMLHVKDADNMRLSRANKAAEQFIAASAGLVPTLKCSDGTNGEIFKNSIADEVVLQKGVPVEFEEWYSNDEKKLVLSTKKVPVYNVNGAPLFVISLSEDITQKKESEEQIKASLHEKNILLSEIHHRVKNNMTIISSLLMLQSGYSKSPELKVILKECCDRIKSMALIHEKLYQSETLAFINFKDYVNDLIRSIQSSYGGNGTYVIFDIDVEDIYLNIVTAMPCGLLLNEIITNAYKHAFKGMSTGTITITFGKNEEHYLMRVSDDGVGISSGKGTAESDSLGLTLVNALCSQLGGKGDFVSDNGTTFVLKFKELKGSEKNFR
jgi:two-component sensor histidine kinase/PAS domain-containing protein